MFVKFDNSEKVSSDLVFIKSTNIKVFPCGRRKTELVDFDGDSATTSDQRYIPIDPEARLNTEANNRKHSGLNGFKQTYLNYWRTTNEFSFVIAGYLFTIKLPDDGSLSTPQAFGTKLAELLGNNIDKIYAHIKLANVAFFSSVDGSNSITSSVGTEILRDQTLADDARPCLDLFIGLDQNNKELNDLDPNKASNYFFSGLSFRASADPSEEGKNEWVLPLLMRESKDDPWVINEACRLPEIDHGDTAKSVKILGSLEVADTTDNNGERVAGEIYAQELNVAINGTKHSVATLDIIKNSTNNTYKLSFNGAVVQNP